MAPTLPLAQQLAHEQIQPSPTTSCSPTRILHDFFKRQETVTVTAVPAPQSSSGSDLDGGAIAGIVIGSIAGFLLILWIIRSCGAWGQPDVRGGRPEPEPYYSSPSRRRRSHHRHSHPVYVEKARSRSPRMPEVVYESRGRARY